MPINPEYLGRSYVAAAPYQVGREKIREFAAAIGESSPLCSDPVAARAGGHADVVAPPTFAIVLTRQFSELAIFDPGLGVDYSRVVHGEQRFSHARPIVAGDELVGTVTIAEIRTAGRNVMLTTRTELTTVAGEPVCTAYSTLVVRGSAPARDR